MSESEDEIIKNHYSKNFLFHNKTPKILRYLIYMGAGIFFIYLIVSLWNYLNFINSFDRILSRIKLLHAIGTRNNLL